MEREYQNALKTGTAGLATTEDMQKFTLKEDSSTMQGTRLKIRLFVPTHVAMVPCGTSTVAATLAVFVKVNGV